MADALERVARQIPVLIASRCGSGETLSCTYGFPGSEIDLQKRGLVTTGWLTGVQARVLLTVLLMSGADRNAIAAELDACRRMNQR
jgi:L-asparaginase